MTSNWPEQVYKNLANICCPACGVPLLNCIHYWRCPNCWLKVYK